MGSGEEERRRALALGPAGATGRAAIPGSAETGTRFRVRATDGRRTTERRATVALFAVAIVLYGGVIPGEIIWKVSVPHDSRARAHRSHR